MTHDDINMVFKHFKPGVEYALLGVDVENIIVADEERLSAEEIEGLISKAWRLEGFSVLRVERNRLLVKSDWTQVADGAVNAAAWAEYRQALRDLPENTVDPENPVWPTPPE